MYDLSVDVILPSLTLTDFYSLTVFYCHLADPQKKAAKWHIKKKKDLKT